MNATPTGDERAGGLASDVTGTGVGDEATRRYVRSPEDLLRLVVFSSIAVLFVGLTVWFEETIVGSGPRRARSSSPDGPRRRGAFLDRRAVLVVEIGFENRAAIGRMIRGCAVPSWTQTSLAGGADS